jgi:outer membrane protein assembly factor BamD
MNGRLFHSRMLAAAVLALVAAACSSDDDKYVERPVHELYNVAMNAMQEGNYQESAKLFDEVERQHPYSVWATRAQLMAAYSHYQENKYDDAIPALDRFIQLHPSNRDVAYAYYLKALCYYEQISDVARDQKMTEMALKTFSELITRFPTSKFARDSKIKRDLTYDHLAGKEMNVGRYYLGQGQHLAAINRFQVVVGNFQTTTHVPEALLRLTESYYALGLDDQARKTAAILGHNFPGSEWYIDSYEMIENKKIRPDEDAWYKFWGSDREITPMQPLPKEKVPWYDFWSDTEKPEAPAPPSPAKTPDKEAAVEPKTEEEPWYKFW